MLTQQQRYASAWMILLGLLIAACGGESRTDRETVVVAQFGDFFLYAPLYVAIDAGFTDDNRLTINLVSTGGDETTWASVLGGSAQFGIADPTFIAIAGERGRPGVIVASLVEGVPFWGVTYDQTIPVGDGVPTLEGRTVGTFPAPSTAYTLQAELFARNNLPARIREGAPGTLLAMLRAGAADIALELEPTVSQAVRDGARVLYSLTSTFPDFAITGVTVQPSLLRTRPDLVSDFVCALQQAMDFIRLQPDSAISILTSRFPEVDRGVAEEALTRAVGDGVIPATPVVQEASWETAVQLRRRTGDLSDAAPFAQYVHNDAAFRAVEQCRILQSPGVSQ